jgi:hypothetical protein
VKRLLWFAALFLAGLGVLLWFENRRTRGGSGLGSTPSTGASEFVAPQDVPSGPSGNFETDLFDDADPALRRKRWNLKFESLSFDDAGSAFRAGRTRLLGFGDETTEPIAELVAQSSRIPSTVGTRPGLYELGREVALRDVDARLQHAGALGSLRLRAAELEGKLDEQEFRSAGTSRIDGDGLACTGTGLHMSLLRSRLSFASKGRIELTTGPQRVYVLTSVGAMEIEAAPKEAGGLLTVRAHDGATLSAPQGGTAGGRATELEGALLTVIAVPLADGSLEIQQLFAEGGTRVRSGDWSAEGERTNVVLGPDGTLRSLRIEGVPTARLPLSDPRIGRTPTEAIWSGQGPLEVSRLEPLEIAMRGPTRVEIAGHTLEAEREIRARMPELAGGPRILDASGSVALESNGWRMEAPTLCATVREPLAGQFVLTAATEGATQLHPLDASQPGRWMRSEGGVELVASEQQWKLTRARGARVHWEGLTTLEAQATEILDFDPAGPSFRAEGSFLLVSGTTTASGVRAKVRDAEHATVEGTPEEPALLERPGERISALYVERDGDVLRARGAIDALSTLDGARRAVQADELELRRSEGVDPDGTRWRGFDLDSRGSVRASLQDERGSADLVCSSLVAQSLVRLPADAQALGPVEQRSTSFEARGVVQSRFAVADDVWELSCGRVTGAGTLSGPPDALRDPASREDALRDSRLDAYDGVAFARLGAAPLRGRAEHLALVGSDRALLEPRPGELVHAEGLLSATEPRAIKLQAALLALEGTRWRAVEPELWISALAADGAFALQADSPDLLWLRASELAYDPPLVELSGDAHVRGTSTRGEPFAVRSGNLHFELADAPDSLARRIRGLSATDGFALSFGETLAATGQDLELRRGAGQLYMTGEPVRLRWIGVEFASPWIEIDLFLRALRTGKFSASPTQAEQERAP